VSRQRSRTTQIQEGLGAGALTGGLFLWLFGLIKAALRVGLLVRGDATLLLPLALLSVGIPLVVGLKFGYVDRTPPALRRYRHALPGQRSPVEEITGLLIGGGGLAAAGAVVAALGGRLTVGGDAIFTAAFASTLLAFGLWARLGPAGRHAGPALFALASLLATPFFLLSPRLPVLLGKGAGLRFLAQEYELRAQREGSPAAAAMASDLARDGCRMGDPSSCFLAASLVQPQPTSALAAGALRAGFLRQGCDRATGDLVACEPLVGSGFAAGPEGGCEVASRCVAGYGVTCELGLAACAAQLQPRGLLPACARRNEAGWREVWCGELMPGGGPARSPVSP
jgi:hypothetical protein